MERDYQNQLKMNRMEDFLTKKVKEYEPVILRMCMKDGKYTPDEIRIRKEYNEINKVLKGI